MRTLFTDCKAHRLPSVTLADWLVVEDGRIAAHGVGDEPGDVDRVVRLDGAHVYPAFVDAHVHLPATGLYLSGLDFRGVTAADRILERFAARRDTGELLFGGNFEDPLDRSIDRHDLDGAVGEGKAVLTRADMHSAIVSSALLAELPLDGLEGVDVGEDGTPTGYLREEAAATAFTWFDRNLPATQAKAAIRDAVKQAYSKGVACVHEMHVVEWRGWEAFDVLREAVADMAMVVVPYVATTDVARVKEMGFHRIGGDYFLDGSFGSHTALLSEPYLTPPPEGSPPLGISYRDDDDLEAFFLEAQQADLQVGVHAIGDAAIEQAIRAWERVAATVGVDAVSRKGHRIEHFECSSDDHLARAHTLGLRASIQPGFDAFWGGEDGLYARRIGWERAKEMNRFGSMIETGLLVGAGSDSTVTPLDPFFQMKALRSHHVEDERAGRTLAIKLHTMGARALAFGWSLDGTLEVGAVGDLIAVNGDLAETPTEDLDSSQLLGTWIGGAQVWPPDGAEID